MGKVNGIEFDSLTWNGKRIVTMLTNHAGIPLCGNEPEVNITVNGLAVDVESFIKELSTWLGGVSKSRYREGQLDARDKIVENFASMINIDFNE